MLQKAQEKIPFRNVNWVVVVETLTTTKTAKNMIIFESELMHEKQQEAAVNELLREDNQHFHYAFN